ncbi:MAG: hypothetical protein DHS20C12_08230 [Pseudohongiella sp.]|nr:MAG: hypothetical protein DHS20C12_08230 [Pseudohongiella sp.]
MSPSLDSEPVSKASTLGRVNVREKYKVAMEPKKTRTRYAIPTGTEISPPGNTSNPFESANILK